MVIIEQSCGILGYFKWIYRVSQADDSVILGQMERSLGALEGLSYGEVRAVRQGARLRDGAARQGVRVLRALHAAHAAVPLPLRSPRSGVIGQLQRILVQFYRIIV